MGDVKLTSREANRRAAHDGAARGRSLYHAEADHLGRLAHHRAARHLRRPDRPAVPGSRAPRRPRRQAGRPVRHRRDRQADPDGAHRRRREARRRAPDLRRPLRGHARGRLGPRGAARRPGHRRRRRRDPVSDRRHDALQPPGLRVQARVLSGLQRVDRRVFRGPPRPAPRHRPDGHALHRGGDPRPRAHQGARAPRRHDAGQSRRQRLRRPAVRARSGRPPSTSGCRCRFTS